VAHKLPADLRKTLIASTAALDAWLAGVQAPRTDRQVAAGSMSAHHVLLPRALTGRRPETVLATSLFGDVAAALREHGSATLDERCYYVRRPD